MDLVANLQAAMGLALKALPAEARFRLEQIIVEEVSYVDRAANKFKFLVVKNHDGVAKQDEQEDLTLSSAVKESLLRTLTEALERTVKIANTVKGAVEVDAESDAQFPPELKTEIQAIVDLLRGVGSGASTEKQEGGMKSELEKLGDDLKALAGTLKGVEKAEGETVEQLKELAGRLAKLAGTEEKPEQSGAIGEKLAGIAGNFTALVDAVGKADDLDEESLKALAGIAEQIGDLTKAVPDAATAEKAAEEEAAKAEAEATAKAEAEAKAKADADAAADADGVEKAGRKLSASRMKQLKDGISAMQNGLKALESLLADVAGGDGKDKDGKAAKADATDKRIMDQTAQPPDRAPGDLGNVGTGPTDDKPAGDAIAATTPELADLMKSMNAKIEGLTKKVAELESTPQPPSSRREAGGGDDNGTPEKPRPRRGGPWIM